MLTRRRLLQHMILAGLPLGSGIPFARAAIAATASTGSIDALLPSPSASAATEDGAGLARFVDVFIGSGGHGHTFPGAAVPFGMVQLSPDTYNADWDACSGYHAGDRSIMGFSHTHLSGTGIGDMLDVLLMPNVGAVKTQPGSREAPESGWRAPFRPEDETGEPGYYRVELRDRRIVAELTATARAGLHRYTFPASAQSHIVVDLKHGMQDNPDTPTRVPWAELRAVGNDTLLGGRSVRQWARDRRIHFAIRFSRPFERMETLGEPATEAATNHGVRCALHFPTREGEQVLVKVGLSAVSAENALHNLDAEIPGWDFEAVRRDARDAWERELGRVRIQARDDDERRVFYTALYHCLLAPTLFNDVDGRYLGMDLAVHQLPPGASNYTQFSLWDTYRSLHPLLTLVQPERVPDLANSLIRMAEQNAGGVPVWPLQARETDCMVGYHSSVVLAEAWTKGFDGIDFAKAWPLWRKRAMDDDYRGLPLYRALGYIPAEREAESVSKTLEYAYDDWAVAHLARAAGDEKEYRQLRERSRNYRNVFDQRSGFVRGRLADGSWAEPFDPRALGHLQKWHDFTECNAWQATFLNQHDVHGHIRLLGGDQRFAAKLDALFSASSDLPEGAPPDISGMVGQYAHGNEPGHHVAYLYAYAGQPWKTQARVRKLMRDMYHAQRDGLPGNEDCGQMSAWFVLSALGLYPVDPVSGVYVFGSPLLDRTELALAEGRRLLIEAHDNSPENVYVQSVSWNGQPHPRNWIAHRELAKGAHLAFRMGATPNLEFGAARSQRPPSFV